MELAADVAVGPMADARKGPPFPRALVCRLGDGKAAIGGVIAERAPAVENAERLARLRAHAAGFGEIGDKGNAAIASALTAKLYGLDILKRDIADEKNNVTRFLALSKKPMTQKPIKNKKYVTSFIFSVKNMPAALYKALGGFATNGVNMLKLESYMPGGTFASTLFYGEVEGHAQEAHLTRALKELTFFADNIRVLGSYVQNRSKLSI